MSIISAQTNTHPFSYTYRTDVAIPKGNIDDVLQYRFHIEFEGKFSDRTSPKNHRWFENPPWYAPVNLNTTYGNETNVNPYSVIYSIGTNTVWINELNYLSF